jgi:hypothetical protein
LLVYKPILVYDSLFTGKFGSFGNGKIFGEEKNEEAI